MQKEETGLGRQGRLSKLRPVTKTHHSRCSQQASIVGRCDARMKPTTVYLGEGPREGNNGKD